MMNGVHYRDEVPETVYREHGTSGFRRVPEADKCNFKHINAFRAHYEV